MHMIRATPVAVACFFSLACSASSTTPHVALVAPPAPSAPPEAPMREDPPPPNAMRIDATSDSSWARTFPRAKDFVALEAREPHNSLILFWRVGVSHRVKDLPPNEDYAANYVAPLDLIVGAQTISFGSPSGTVNPFALSFCARAGWHAENQPTSPVGRHVVSFFSVGVIQGDTDIMVVRDGSTLHVLHR
jgi:hypothetical protein